ncbi:hypothetical protein [Fructilactobacillus frigidiflavus]|uniref:hypothetical protein n=1 Tax=Fructilactobacillus frigidiflavus TaxID=3242688 RepID=UPI003757F0D5
MNKKFIFLIFTFSICVIGLISSTLHSFKNEYLLQYFGLSSNLAGGIHVLVSFVIVVIIVYDLWHNRKPKK